MDELTAIEMNDVSLRHHENGNPLAGLGGPVTREQMMEAIARQQLQPSWYDKLMYGVTGDVTYLPGQKAPVVVAPKTPAQVAAQEAKFEQIRMETEAANALKFAPKPAPNLFPDWVFVPGLLRTDSRTAAEGAVITDAQKAAKDASKVIANDIAAKIVEGSKGERANILDNGHVILDDRRKIPNWAPWAAVGGLGFLVLIMAVRR
jgi:hypothetical protein